jgi:hypothetical protein
MAISAAIAIFVAAGWIAWIESKCISFRVSSARSQPLASVGIQTSAFSRWFAQEDTPLEIIKLNPGLEFIEVISKERFKGHLKPLKFPGLSVSSIIEFQTTSQESKFEIICNEGAITQIFEGNMLLVKIFSALTFDAETECICNESNLEIRFGVPSWFPFDRDASQTQGSSVIQQSIEKDIEELTHAQLC